MPSDTTIVEEKVAQATAILNELDADCWLTFVRETGGGGDPVLPLILGQGLTWQSALILTRHGDRIAIVGKYEDEAVRSTGVWTEVIPYVQGIAEPLRETLTRLAPRYVLVNYSRDDVKADGLSHGMFLLLGEHLAGTPYADMLFEASALINALRARKTPGEIDRMRRAIATTDEIFCAVASFAEPGKKESEIAAFMHDQAEQRGVGLAWDRGHCPIVTTGSGSMVGHGMPSDTLSVQEGNVFHLDFGVQQDDYCSDLQRVWYVPKPGETSPPETVQRAFETVRAAIEAAASTLKPGVEGWRVDEAARKTIVDAGYPEYQHATGHHVGRDAHDGGGVLGPKWERYGNTPRYELEPGNVVTLELGVDDVDGRGYLGLEEMALVTEDGFEWLSVPQREVWMLGKR